MWVDVKKPHWSDEYLVCLNWMERDVDTSYHQWDVKAKFRCESEAYAHKRHLDSKMMEDDE